MGDIYAAVTTADLHRLAAEMRQLKAQLAERDAEIAQLEAWKAAVPVNDIAFLVGATDASLGETPQSARVVKWANALIDKLK